MNATERQSRQMQADREELADRIARAVPRDGRQVPQPGLMLMRASTTAEPHYAVAESCFCVIAQGSKQVTLGDERFRYDPNHYLISTVGLPTVSQVVDASPDRPYLGVGLVLDPGVVTSVMVES